jgi:hypothetical protein
MIMTHWAKQEVSECAIVNHVFGRIKGKKPIFSLERLDIIS